MKWLLPTCLALPAFAAPVTYTLAPPSTIDVRVYKDGIAQGLAHDHVMRASAVSGTITYDPDTRQLLGVRIEVDATRLEVDPPRVRHLYGMDNDLDAGDRAEIGTNMRAQDQLNVEAFPKITFESKTFGVAPDGRIDLGGQLTLRGQTRDVRLPVAIWATPERLQGKGSLRIRHTDFGFQPYSALGGAIRNQDHLDLIISLKAEAPVAAPPPAPPSAPPSAPPPAAPSAPASAPGE